MNIVVFGSFAVDLSARAIGLPEPGETLIGTSFAIGPGGKGSNQAVAAHRAGADVTLVTKLGGDLFADVAYDFYKQEGIDSRYILHDDSMSTGVALILVDDNTAQNMIVITPGACSQITIEDIESRRQLIEGAKVLLLQMEINIDALVRLVDIAAKAGVKVVLNPAPAQKLPNDILNKIDVLTPNETEAYLLTGVRVNSEQDARQAADILNLAGVKQVVITMGSKGVFACDGTRSVFEKSLVVQAVDTTGAGDAFNGGLVTALSEGKDLFASVRFANVVGALSVTRLGTAPSMPRRIEIDDLYDKYYQR